MYGRYLLNIFLHRRKLYQDRKKSSRAFRRTPLMHSLRLLLSYFPRFPTHFTRHLSTRRPPPRPSAAASTTGLDEWNDAWETAWLPNDDDPSAHHTSTSITPTDRAPWESSDTSESVNGDSLVSADMDEDTKAFVAEMDER